MGDPQNSDEEFLALLQPLKMPDEFTFEARLRHFADSSDDEVEQEAIPKLAPLAPMAPMAPMDAVASATQIKESEEPASLPPSETNGHQDKTVNGLDDDEIEYETPKTSGRSPAKRSTRSRVQTRPRRDGDEELPYQSAAELLRRFATSSAKKPVESEPDNEDDVKVKGGFQVKTGKSRARGFPGKSVEFEAESSPEVLNFEVVIKSLSSTATQEYTKVPPGDEIYRVLEIIRTDVPGESWLSVEFEDGRVDQVSSIIKRTVFSMNRLASLIPFCFLVWQQTKWKAAACCPPQPFTFYYLRLSFSLLLSTTVQKRHLPSCIQPPLDIFPISALHLQGKSFKHQTSNREESEGW